MLLQSEAEAAVLQAALEGFKTMLEAVMAAVAVARDLLPLALFHLREMLVLQLARVVQAVLACLTRLATQVVQVQQALFQL
jgi:hypothetical protein